ncbi:LRRN4 C-terminal-like protein [Gastrophryne carolinensis]
MSSLHLLLIGSLSAVLAIEDPGSLNRSINLTVTTTLAPFLANSTKVTQSPKTTQDWPEYVTSGPEEDYYYDDTEPTVTSAPPAFPGQCLYDRCKHLSPTCEEIQSKAGGTCLCPGIDGPSKKPDPPNVNQVTSGEEEVTVKWCSPLSTVHNYIVLYLGSEGPIQKGPLLNSSYRAYSIQNLLPNTRYTLCVVAKNNAGYSDADMTQAEEDTTGSMTGACRIFRTSPSKQSYIYLGVGLGLGALAVVLAVLASLWCIRQKRNKQLAAEEEEQGIPNASYKVGSKDHL